jgi:hypothetical protein
MVSFLFHSNASGDLVIASISYHSMNVITVLRKLTSKMTLPVTAGPPPPFLKFRIPRSTTLLQSTIAQHTAHKRRLVHLLNVANIP